MALHRRAIARLCAMTLEMPWSIHFLLFADVLANLLQFEPYGRNRVPEESLQTAFTGHSMIYVRLCPSSSCA